MYTIDLTNVKEKQIFPLGSNFRGVNPNGNELGFTNYYMTLDGMPFFGISGEVHYCRVREDEWEDTIIKAKMGGLNIIASYIFWNVHEEIRGKFRFDGNRNIRRFLELCHKHGMYAIVRIGPFCHGEMRNGGLPDWLYGLPFEVRSNDEGYLYYVRRLFQQLHQQFDGLYYSQGGPIIATQIENEYMHAGAPWEMTTGISHEWITGGTGGETHMRLLKKIAQEEGIVTPFYTCTGWGGAMAPFDEMLPLWGGYAYWPWHVNSSNDVHPMTPEYIYRDNHNDDVSNVYNFDPLYSHESMPYACCEMMGGMFNSYRYRYILDPLSVDAMANTKLASGCNLLGYFMYRGGTNPLGERTPYLHENYIPKRSYDFQAAISENGTPRESYFRLKQFNAFCTAFTPELINTRTVLPEHMVHLQPGELTPLRYAVRICNNSGFLFLNNFQDHASMPDIVGASITLKLPKGDLTFDGISMTSGENAILPFHLDLFGAKLIAATAQPITKLQGDIPCIFFLMPEGMKPKYRFDRSSVQNVDGCAVTEETGELICTPAETESSSFLLTTHSGQVRIVNLTRKDSLGLSKVTIGGKEYALLSDGTLLWDGKKLTLESDARQVTVMAYPGDILTGCPGEKTRMDIFEGVRLSRPEETLPVTATAVGNSRYLVKLPSADMKPFKRVELHIDYAGDIGNLFLDGQLIADNFCNGATWVTRIDPWIEESGQLDMTLYIVPIRKNATICVDSPMAAQFESAESTFSQLDSVKLVPVAEWTVYDSEG